MKDRTDINEGDGFHSYLVAVAYVGGRTGSTAERRCVSAGGGRTSGTAVARVGSATMYRK